MKNLEMINLNEEMRLLDLGEYGEEIINYKSDWICDCIGRIADNNTSIYYHDIMEFIKNHTDEFDESVELEGWQGSIYEQGRLVEYKVIYEDLYNNLDNIIKYYVYNYITNDLGFDEITEDDFDELNDRLETEIESDNSLESIIDIIIEVLKKH